MNRLFILSLVLAINVSYAQEKYKIDYEKSAELEIFFVLLSEAKNDGNLSKQAEDILVKWYEDGCTKDVLDYTYDFSHAYSKTLSHRKSKDKYEVLETINNYYSSRDENCVMDDAAEMDGIFGCGYITIYEKRKYYGVWLVLYQETVKK